MPIIIASRRTIHYETKGSGEHTVLYVPGQGAPTIQRGTQNKSASEIAARYGDSRMKPLIREIDSEIGVYGMLEESLCQRRNAMKVYLPQDFLSSRTRAYYFLFGDKHIIHGHKTVDDEGKEHWGSSVITLQGGDPVKIIQSAISERMLDGNIESILVAVESTLEKYEELKQALNVFDIKTIPFASLKVDKDVEPLYQHKDHSLVMLLIAFLLLLSAIGIGFMWWKNGLTLEKLNKKVRAEKLEIQRLQSSNTLGYILRPQQVLSQMQTYIDRPASSYIQAAAKTAAEFGTLNKLTADTSQFQWKENIQTGARKKVLALQATVDQQVEMLLVDQEYIAKQLIEKNSWLRKIENKEFNSGSLLLNLEVNVEGAKYE